MIAPGNEVFVGNNKALWVVENLDFAQLSCVSKSSRIARDTEVGVI